jgi:hypothetical protein
MKQVSSRGLNFTGLHGVTSRKIELSIVTAVRTSDLAMQLLVSFRIIVLEQLEELQERLLSRTSRHCSDICVNIE